MPGSFWCWVLTLFLWVVAYFVGSVPAGVLIARWQGKDLRSEGSGNIGATNATRVLGKSWGIVVFALDVLKGLLPVLLTRWWLPQSDFSVVSVAFAAVAGHIWSAFLHFQGGKGISTLLGCMLGMNWLVALLVLVVWVLVTQATRYVSVGSVVAVFSSGYIAAIVGMPRWYILWTALAVCLAIYTHRANLQRLMKGTEAKIGSRSKE
jgi:acyl phosphate:glycerol-3-phosphate acyltransferase